jgi:hypothetical protein
VENCREAAAFEDETTEIPRKAAGRMWQGFMIEDKKAVRKGSIPGYLIIYLSWALRNN